VFRGLGGRQRKARRAPQPARQDRCQGGLTQARRLPPRQATTQRAPAPAGQAAEWLTTKPRDSAAV